MSQTLRGALMVGNTIRKKFKIEPFYLVFKNIWGAGGMAPLEWRTCIAAFSRISLFNLIFVVTGWQPPSRRVGPEKRLKMLVTKVVVVA